MIAFTDERRRRRLVTATALADLLSVAAPMPRLVVLNSCQTAVGSDTDVFSSTAATLVRTVPAVVAMQFAVSDDAAAVFSRTFYQALLHNRGVDEAVRVGRIALTGWNVHTLEWVTPVLYLRSRDTHLFKIAALRTKPDLADSEREHRDTADGPVAESTSRGDIADPAAPAPEQARKRPSASAWPAIPPPPQPKSTASQRPRAAPEAALVLAGHTAAVSDVVFRPDGELLASCSLDRTVQLWDPVTGGRYRTLTGHTDYLTGLAFSPDGRMLASCAEERRVLLWDPVTGVRQPTLAQSGKLRALMGGARWDVGWSVAFSPDGGLLACACHDHTVRLWDPQTGSALHTLTGHTAPVRGGGVQPRRPAACQLRTRRDRPAVGSGHRHAAAHPRQMRRLRRHGGV
ncbi:CHAT domain-containing protein [Streptomyces lutosisoli]|uniref:CHAT domain-containing protein n=1 Tax=Streptomyces lutosisoli TaxID=2665721 RepID=A0ABW2VT06_9ACTN